MLKEIRTSVQNEHARTIADDKMKCSSQLQVRIRQLSRKGEHVDVELKFPNGVKVWDGKNECISDLCGA